ncbi:hypothetical protein M8C21_024165 [Ambrosia artemisiifolia]|uniref:Uncharacterized protein n=1 Tax=Ambrosia artemisiifolia TaxID=4212 RepID=A0AAD5C1V6_AMBAR|nr:hypothetical protein M8C21_024165 [Ambrosia artemisiifolia]
MTDLNHIHGTMTIDRESSQQNDAAGEVVTKVAFSGFERNNECEEFRIFWIYEPFCGGGGELVMGLTVVFNNSLYDDEDDDDLPCDVVDLGKKEKEFGGSSCSSSYLNEEHITSSFMRRHQLSVFVRFFGTVEHLEDDDLICFLEVEVEALSRASYIMSEGSATSFLPGCCCCLPDALVLNLFL